MSKEGMDDDIDEVFKNALDTLKTEPPKEFWTEAIENIILRSNKAAPPFVFRWRNIALALMLLVGVMSFSTLYFYAQSRDKNTGINPTSSATVLNTPNPMHHTLTKKERNTITGSNTKTIITNEYSSAIGYSGDNTNGANGSVNKNKKVTPVVNITKLCPTKRKQVPGYSITTTALGNLNLGTNIPVASKGKPAGKLITKSCYLKPNSMLLIEKPAVLWPMSPKEFIQDSLIQIGSIPISATASSRFSLSVFFSPDIISGNNFKGNGSFNEINGSQLKNNENNRFSYSMGVKVEIPLSTHFSLSTGLSYHYFSSRFNSQEVYYQKEPDGTMGYAVITSSGITDCPYYGTSLWGNSLLINGVSSRYYTCIPLQVKYRFPLTKKLHGYVMAGGSANFAISSVTTMHWQDNAQYFGNASVNSIKSLKRIYYSYCLGAGTEYDLSNYFSIYAEPDIQEGLTPINKSSPIISYPYSVSLSLGVTYHINK